MKRKIAIIAFLMICSSSFAQLRGQANLEYGHYMMFDEESGMVEGNNYSVQYGLKFNDYWFLGAGIGINTLKEEYGIPLQINARYYANPLNSVCGFISATGGYSEYVTKEIGGWSAGIDLGCDIFVGSTASITFAIGPIALWRDSGTYGGLRFKIGLSL